MAMIRAWSPESRSSSSRTVRAHRPDGGRWPARRRAWQHVESLSVGASVGVPRVDAERVDGTVPHDPEQPVPNRSELGAVRARCPGDLQECLLDGFLGERRSADPSGDYDCGRAMAVEDCGERGHVAGDDEAQQFAIAER